MENFRSPYKTYVVTMNDMSYTVRAKDWDEAMCTAYRKYHKGKVNVFGDILWHLGVTKEKVTITEVQ